MEKRALLGYPLLVPFLDLLTVGLVGLYMRLCVIEYWEKSLVQSKEVQVLQEVEYKLFIID